MTDTLSVLGNMIFPNAPGGSNNSLPIGAPEVISGSTTGAQLEYEEKTYFEYKVAAGGTQIVNFGSVADGDFIYVGTDSDVTYTLNGGSEVFSIAEDGFMMMMNASITALTITNAGPLTATVIVLICGD